jgi:ComF family protein
MTPLFKALRDFVNLVYPDTCAACGINLLRNEHFLCSRCLAKLPRTRFHSDPENPVCRLFWGRVYVTRATAFFYYLRGSRYQSLIHKLKYKGKKEIGYELGRMLGSELLVSREWNSVQVVVPVPLHPHREKKRGYNQAFWIAKGVAEAMHLPVSEGNLIRAVETSTQTKKGRYERFENVDEIFRITETSLLEGKHILLVDDVITTGSTTEACANTLLRVNGTRVSIAALGTA